MWHAPVLAAMPKLELTLLVGSYAQRYYLNTKGAMSETVHNWQAYLPKFIPLPHPSWRNTSWLRKNPWFDAELVPYLRERMATMLLSPSSSSRT